MSMIDGWTASLQEAKLQAKRDETFQWLLDENARLRDALQDLAAVSPSGDDFRLLLVMCNADHVESGRSLFEQAAKLSSAHKKAREALKGTPPN